MTRAKFTLTKYETTVQRIYTGMLNNVAQYETKEVRTLFFQVVSSGSDENKSFFASTPSGEMRLSLVSPETWSRFELNKDYYLDFTPAV